MTHEPNVLQISERITRIRPVHDDIESGTWYAWRVQRLFALGRRGRGCQQQEEADQGKRLFLSTGTIHQTNQVAHVQEHGVANNLEVQVEGELARVVLSHARANPVAVVVKAIAA